MKAIVAMEKTYNSILKKGEIKVQYICVQWIATTKKKYFFLVRPVILYEISDNIDFVKLFPRDLFQERDNLELKVVNYILYGNGKSIRGISY
ncbi:DNA-directed RNA polymerase subunit beta [Medicago truncatula]|uniref:DNA-directed RNA polymerase subunit beta n=1 Tax=Medicago truncatula TaxID=3880 RepID=G7JZJ6_MEDTR|nr:DNA-directed RNA polymerase subunit beta [Medicago truncatula]